MIRNGHAKWDSGDRELPVYPIRTVSKLTGVGEGTLRAWEVRYGIINPARTPGGHRLFSEKDIDKIIEIKKLLHKDGLSMAGVQKLIISSEEAGRG